MFLRRCSVASFVPALIVSALVAVAQNRQPPGEPQVPCVATTNEAVQAMLKLADVKKDDIVYDLGCGDGRIVIEAPRNFARRQPAHYAQSPELQYMLLQPNLIYTGITRGKNLVVLIGQRKALRIAVSNNKTQRRYSGLLEALTADRTSNAPVGAS